jgi:hypothetical protein
VSYLLLTGSLLLVWVLLPLLPAILIYWLFPDTKVTASGPLAELTVAASGAFAAFLIVLVVIAPFVYSIRDGVIEQRKHENEIEQQRRTDSLEQDKRNYQKQLASGKQYWTVEVPVELIDSDDKKITNPLAIQNYLNPNTLDVKTTPSSVSVASSKIILRIVTLTPNEFPFVRFKLPQSDTMGFNLSDVEIMEINPESFSIKVKTPMKIPIAQQNQEAQRAPARSIAIDERLAK